MDFQVHSEKLSSSKLPIEKHVLLIVKKMETGWNPVRIGLHQFISMASELGKTENFEKLKESEPFDKVVLAARIK